MDLYVSRERRNITIELALRDGGREGGAICTHSWRPASIVGRKRDDNKTERTIRTTASASTAHIDTGQEKREERRGKAYSSISLDQMP